MAVVQKTKRTFTGVVVSNRGDKTIVVEVVRRVKHAMYKKYIKKSKKFHAHDEHNVCQMGDTVRIVEHKPISKLKAFVLDTVIEKAD